jgi:disulfide bond formation protein DsbB
MGSAVLLAGALFSQYAMGLQPCELCIWQRWPHLVAVVLGIIAMAFPASPLMVLGASAAATTGGIGIYHTGVERGWFQGPQACSAMIDFGSLSAEELLNRVLAAPVVRCDEVAWEMLGLSMASWNAILSFGLAGVWLAAALRRV